jgi:hypothetical protein
MTKPQLIEHDGVLVVRDDLFPGGTKARYLPLLFDGAGEVVYGEQETVRMSFMTARDIIHKLATS